MITKDKDFYCVRCKMAAYYVATDSDWRRGQENWYKYQAELKDIDKATIPLAAPGTNPICAKCGHRKLKNRYGEDLVMRLN